jgi:hypothetical protein
MSPYSLSLLLYISIISTIINYYQLYQLYIYSFIILFIYLLSRSNYNQTTNYNIPHSLSHYIHIQYHQSFMLNHLINKTHLIHHLIKSITNKHITHFGTSKKAHYASIIKHNSTSHIWKTGTGWIDNK